MKREADILMQRDDVAALLKEASLQMGLMRKKRDHMEQGASILPPELPRSLAIIAPLINEYYEDRMGWLEFVRYVRDNGPWDLDSAKWKEVQHLMRNENSNAVQFRRRMYAGLAADLKEKTFGKGQRGDRTAYMKAVQKLWKDQLKFKVSKARAESGKKHLPQDEQMEVSDKFWTQIESDINAGKIPIFDDEDSYTMTDTKAPARH